MKKNTHLFLCLLTVFAVAAMTLTALPAAAAEKACDKAAVCSCPSDCPCLKDGKCTCGDACKCCPKAKDGTCPKADGEKKGCCPKAGKSCPAK